MITTEKGQLNSYTSLTINLFLKKYLRVSLYSRYAQRNDGLKVALI